MKRALFTGIIAALCFFSSCKDKCENTVCENGGTCDNGTCLCPTGYSGENCQNQTDPCRNVTCVNGLATEGSNNTCACECDAGYTGVHCDILERDAFINMNGDDPATDCNGTSYGIQVVPGGQDNEIKLVYLGAISGSCGGNYQVVAIVDGDSFTIPQQVVCGNYTFTGTGSLVGNTVTVDYSYTDGTQNVACTITYNPG